MNNSKKVVNGMSEQNIPNPQEQQTQEQLLTMPWMVLSNQIQTMDRNLNQRLDDFKENVNSHFTDIDKRFDSVDKQFDSVNKQFDGMEIRFDQMDVRLANRMNIWLAVVLMIFSVLLGFLLGHVNF